MTASRYLALIWLAVIVALPAPAEAGAGAKTARPELAAAEAAGPAIRLRTGEHAGFSRLVFDWPARVGYRVERRPGGALLSFDRPARLDLTRFRADPPPRVTSLVPGRSGGGLTVTLGLPENIELHHFRDGSKVVIDLRSAVPNKAAAQQTEKQEPAAKRPAAKPPEAKAADAKQLESKPESKPEPEPKQAEPKQAEPKQAETRAKPAAAPPPTKVHPEIAPKPEPAPQPEPKSTATPATGLVAAYERLPLPAQQPVPGYQAPRDAPLVIRLTWSREVAAAAFRRGRYLWLVFDAPTRAKLARQIGKVAPELKPVEQWSDDGATVLRFAATSGLGARLTREDGGWRVDLRPRLGPPESAIDYEVLHERTRSQVIFPLEGGGRLLSLTDPDLGDRLYVVPVTTPGLGLAGIRRFPQFQALASFQGLVVASLSDRARVQLEARGVRVSGSGLQVTPEMVEAGTEEDGTAKRHRLLYLAAWRRGGARAFLGNRQVLQRNAVSPTDPNKLDLARLELARFYFAHGLATETRSVLDLMARSSQRFARDPQLILLRAASSLLMQDYAVAAAGLADPALAGEWDAVTWRAALAAAAQDWAYAAQLFDQAEPLIGAYPRAVRVRLGLLAAEARLGIGDSGGASLYLEQIRQDQPTLFEQARLDYLEGRRLLIDRQNDKAVELWREVARSSHPPSQARARLALLEYGLGQGTLDSEAAIAELERLRFLWRGDQFEFALLERLAALYEDRGEHRAALHALRQAASHFPGSARAKAAARRMTDIFVAVNLGDSEPPLKTMALYEEFKELTPVGALGNQLIERLIDRLVAVDLLARAAELLAEQIEQRLKGEERARATNRLALIYLLDRRPQDTLDVLTAAPPGDTEQAAGEILTERRHLSARALADLGRGKEALDRLRGDDGEAAQKLRAELLWALADWPAAAVALARFVPPPGGRPLEAGQRRTLINLAIAHTLAGDRRALDDLARRYGAAIAESPDAEAFTLLTSDFDSPQIGAITQELADVDRVQDFLAGYKARLAEAGLSGVN